MAIVPSAKDLGKRIAKDFGAVNKVAENTGKSAGSRLMGAMGAVAKKAALGAFVGAGVAAGAALVSGFASAVNQQTSEKVLSGLYGSAEKATRMMEDLRKVSSQSPVEYSAYTKAAEALAYAGVEGDQAVSVLENVGHAITATGGTSEHMDRATAAVTKMVNAGKVSLDSLQELSGSGTPIISGLAEHFGVSMDKINEMASEGAIGLEDVISVMENATGENFQKSLAGSAAASQSFGNQFKIAKDNIVTAIGSALVPALEAIAPAIQPVSDAIVSGIDALPGIFDSVTESAQKVWGVLKDWSPMILGIAGAVAAWNIVQGISNALSWAAYLWQSRYVLMGAARIAITNGMALAQRGLNAAMRANPIGLIITAIMLLVGAFVTAYNNLDWFKNFVDTAWAAIKTAISVVVDWFVNVAWPWMQQAISALGAWFVNLYQSYIKPAWDGIWAAIQLAWSYIEPVFNFIVNAIKTYLIIYFQLLWTVVQIVWASIQIAIQVAWAAIKIIFDAIVSFVKNVLGPIFTWLYENLIKPVWDGIKWYITTSWDGIKIIFNAIKGFLENTLGPAFSWFYNNLIKPVWDGISSTISSTWDWIKTNVFDPLANAVKKTLPDAFEAGKDAIGEAWDKVREVAKKPVKFVVNTVINKGIIDNFNKIASVFSVDKIDKVSLPSGFATGGYTGPGRKYKPAGIVHADEYVIRKESQRKISRNYGRGALDYMNRFGRIPGMGYAKGGKVKGGTLWDAAQWWIAKGARAGRHSWFNGGRRITSGHSRNSYHYRDLAVDFNYGPGGQNATEQAFFDRHIGAFQALFPGIRTIWRAPGHYDHLHIDTSKGANMGSGSAGGGGGLDFLAPFRGIFDKIKDGIDTTGAFGGMVAGAAKKMVQAPIDWITDQLGSIVEGAGDVLDAVGTRATKEQVRAVAATYGWGLGEQWNALDELIMRESTWNPNAANPDTSARGLFQKMVSAHGPVERTVVGQARWGLNYIKGRYGTPLAALRHHDRNNWYAKGGLVGTLYDQGGVLPPGNHLVANKTRKPEYILPARVTDALMNGSLGRSGDTYNLFGPDPVETAREVERMRRRRELLAGV